MKKKEEYFYEKCKPSMIPKITDAKLEEMIKIIKPVKQVDDHRFREILTDGVDRRGVAYTWDPKLGRPVQIYRGGLNDVTMMTFHTWAYYGFFKPTLAEAYGCIRAFVPNWEDIRYFWLDSDNMDSRNIMGDYHWCPCILFGPEMTNVVDDEWTAYVKSLPEKDRLAAEKKKKAEKEAESE